MESLYLYVYITVLCSCCLLLQMEYHGILVRCAAAMWLYAKLLLSYFYFVRNSINVQIRTAVVAG